MKEITYQNLLDSLNSVDSKDRFDNSEIQLNIQDIESIVGAQIKYEQKTVLGFDIYQYSQYNLPQQSLIPFVFDLLYKEAVRYSTSSENLIFPESTFTDNFIPTGDGGFLVFTNPLQAVVFNAIFYGMLLTFNSFRFYPKLREYIGPITLRSCISTDNLYHYSDNYYGPAIITNARILSKDKLNRFLIDETTNQWFLKKINGIENITQITIEDISEILTIDLPQKTESLFFCSEAFMLEASKDRKKCKFIDCHIQKIGSLLVKNNKMSVYNIELQSFMYLVDECNNEKGKCFTVSIGNLNCTGISET